MTYSKYMYLSKIKQFIHSHRNMMQPGFSRSWPEALHAMTGSSKMSARSFLLYFLPLYDFLASENAKSNECIGWGGKLLSKALNHKH